MASINSDVTYLAVSWLETISGSYQVVHVVHLGLTGPPACPRG